jgi:hypothetical protein
MNSYRKIAIFALVSLLFFSLSPILAQTQTPAQTDAKHAEEMVKPRLEGLKEFHDVLHPVWHAAYPEKDYQAINESVPEFNERMKVIEKAELPGFFREKEEDFKKKREALANAVLDLEKSARGDNNQELLKATENLHTAYEQLVRVFAPRVKELENFHLVLYPLWHEAFPEKDYDAMMASVPKFQEKMDLLMKVELSDKFKGISKEFTEKRMALKKSLDEFAKACNKKDKKGIEDKLDKMHTAFMDLDGVFETE